MARERKHMEEMLQAAAAEEKPEVSPTPVETEKKTE
jgi:hypothetical protein